MQECFDHTCFVREACQLYIRHKPGRMVLLSYEASLRGCDYFTPINSLKVLYSGRRKKYVKFKAKAYVNRSVKNQIFVST